MRSSLASVGFALLSLLLVLGCGAVATPASLPLSEPLVLPGSDGRTYDLRATVARSRLTAFVFYARSCPCLAVHEARVEALAAAYRARGVSWFLVNSEAGADPSEDALEARRRGYTLPLLTDRGGRLAKSVHAEFATHTVVVDDTGRVRYSGAIDSDKNRLHADARAYLSDALNELLAGREPRDAEREPLGCALTLY